MRVAQYLAATDFDGGAAQIDAAISNGDGAAADGVAADGVGGEQGGEATPTAAHAAGHEAQHKENTGAATCTASSANGNHGDDNGDVISVSSESKCATTIDQDASATTNSSTTCSRSLSPIPADDPARTTAARAATAEELEAMAVAEEVAAVAAAMDEKEEWARSEGGERWNGTTRECDRAGSPTEEESEDDRKPAAQPVPKAPRKSGMKENGGRNDMDNETPLDENENENGPQDNANEEDVDFENNIANVDTNNDEAIARAMQEEEDRIAEKDQQGGGIKSKRKRKNRTPSHSSTASANTGSRGARGRRSSPRQKRGLGEQRRVSVGASDVLVGDNEKEDRHLNQSGEDLTDAVPTLETGTDPGENSATLRSPRQRTAIPSNLSDAADIKVDPNKCANSISDVDGIACLGRAGNASQLLRKCPNCKVRCCQQCFADAKEEDDRQGSHELRCPSRVCPCRGQGKSNPNQSPRRSPRKLQIGSDSSIHQRRHQQQDEPSELLASEEQFGVVGEMASPPAAVEVAPNVQDLEGAEADDIPVDPSICANRASDVEGIRCLGSHALPLKTCRNCHTNFCTRCVEDAENDDRKHGRDYQSCPGRLNFCDGPGITLRYGSRR
jgi:hypothetical protein